MWGQIQIYIYKKNQKLKFLISRDIQAINSVLTLESLYTLCTPGFGQFIWFFLADPLSSVRLDGKHLWTVVFGSLHRCCVQYKSGK